MLKFQKIKGFTLVEIILYVAILGVILTVVTSFSLDALQEKSEQKSKQMVKQDVDFVLDKISHEIESATSVDKNISILDASTPYGKIVLSKKNGSSVTISLTGSTVYLQKKGGPLEKLSTSGSKITSLNFLADREAGHTLKEVQIKIHAESADGALNKKYSDDFQVSIVPKNADSDKDGCLDVVDQYPFDAICCKDSDNDKICDEKDNCPLRDNTDQEDKNGDLIGDSCQNIVDDGSGGTSSGDPEADGGPWGGDGTIDSCVYTCHYTNPFWQAICEQFECFYTGNIDDFETDVDNDVYAGVGQVFSLDSETMYWKKIFTINSISVASIPKVDNITIDLNYCHSGTRLDTSYLKGRCFGNGRHINGYFDGNQEIQLFNYTNSNWDTIAILEAHLNNNDEIDTQIVFSNHPEKYININKEIMFRVKFVSTGAPWSDPQRWYFWPSRYLMIDKLNLSVHVQDLSYCGDHKVEMDEQCDDGSHCSDGTECTSTGASLCVGIGDQECKPRDGLGDKCSAFCLNEDATCGNNLIEVGEQCDDHNLVNGDGCNSICEVETCGNKTIEGTEECDTGTVCENGTACSTDPDCFGIGDDECKMRDGDFPDKCSQYCLNEICSNNRVDYGEQCDDGNLIDGDGCNSICRFELCGNQIKDAGEACDDGTTCSDYEPCTSDAFCITRIGAGEVCIQRDDDNCNNSCEIQFCGDTHTTRSVENCDNGMQCGDVANTPCTTTADCLGIGDNQCLPRDLDSCSAICQIEYPVCGNGAQEFGEQCDYGNANDNDGDGCSHTCMNEYIANYNYANSTLNGKGLGREAWVVGTSAQPPVAPSSITEATAYGATKPYQIEFDVLDGLQSQAANTNYNLIKEDDSTHYTANFSESSYLDHKYDFKVGENEFSSTETMPKRIEYIEITWNGSPSSTWSLSRNVTLYIWNGSQWQALSTKIWNFLESNNKTITAKISTDIGKYIDSNRMIHLLVGVDKKGADILNTDFLDVNIKAYPYRAGYE